MSRVLSTRHASAQDDISMSDQVQCGPKRTVNKRVDYRLLNLRGKVSPTADFQDKTIIFYDFGRN